MSVIWEYLQNTQIAGNETWRVAVFFGGILLSLIIGKIGKYLFNRAAKKQEEADREFIAVVFSSLSQALTFFAFAIGLKISLGFIQISESVDAIVQPVTASLVVAAFAYGLYVAVDVVNFWLVTLSKKTQSKLDDMLMPLVRKSLRVTIVILALLQIATILSDKPLTSVLAGLGVGGLAVALAAQETIKNFFGSLVIFSDKPFELGDRVVVDGYDGIIEEVGFRSTRLRTLDGHFVTVPNGELANKTIQNIGKRPFIKHVMDLGVTYDTPPDKVKLAVDILKELLKDHEGMDKERPALVHFDAFNDSALNIKVIYWYHPPEYLDYCAFHEKLCFAILERFNSESIEFAFPTQTLFVKQES